MSDNQKNTTHFGYQEVPVDEKVNRVADVFHSVAAKYDVMNDLMSGGIHRIWKRITIESSGARPGHKILDIAGGTGDLTRRFAQIVGQSGKVVLADINDSMLKVGRDKLIDKGVAGNVEYVQANAECLPFEDNTFDIITIAFGLRNVTDKDAALRSMNRVLKPGGKLMVLEFSKTENPLLTKAYDFYSFNLLPKMGQLIANDAESYRYLAESIRMHPDQETLKGMMDSAGFVQTRYRNLTQGIVALHTGIKP
ncbi:MULTISPECIES: bifunctional demethylmenaquinone methyltransferase/2-methoxy-6-polyprenyl-1,4-benzoquinol methylase UbiE [unclassified Marinobacterium]|jgi:demethylmenaquinone methyltransferase/2-methoxy-6-polyprenyl-1,4-benzoquinol methylase|uniref:bifunctional demethylmenaquinone methyltransferase/2-methoxy-6-polyprenyl-1,4-benzoquinol methylase UbiE n=1 Tax=unclassified Marinobacterium TaxID=2644139 RepID=UPI001568AEB4|nr:MULTISPECIES: bifunctional demethylmenaquinone methyltransferase/2-methoxy-6-polyprenyl-1,4-benzoquinol methylase UbiE [unclassified Marinobacterium]NRP09004.1 Ubiquinone/menaquinone biosynthesis C-methyltransferase UbiE [Marinobacterium sp. xm-g-48]NRP15133.1 Ubiquinone/menaquinone biosynthesis C-methyltransferase UbiE [Marinobacterium sp. xm-a-152]NRP35889.1 Ubiquinone/menaquinone biosynthesis C-methyltransferase UbiE [Marinobacterium sp. xm-d-579]NRP39466.1 Ubiquinone/menaquinone biosynth